MPLLLLDGDLAVDGGRLRCRLSPLAVGRGCPLETLGRQASGRKGCDGLLTACAWGTDGSVGCVQVLPGVFEFAGVEDGPLAEDGLLTSVEVGELVVVEVVEAPSEVAIRLASGVVEGGLGVGAGVAGTVAKHGHELWPRPGRILLARPGMTFRMLADAINDAFARWDRSHLHAFTLADGTRISIRGPWAELDDDELDDTTTTLSRLQLGEQFTFEFDFGDSWMHLCTVAEEKVDPHEVYGEAPDRPVAYWGWGWIPDQYGRRWDGDDGEPTVPPPPDPPLSDLPDLHYTWGSRAFPSPTPQVGEAPEGDDDIIVGPWGDLPEGSRPPDLTPWSYGAIQDLRKAVAQRDVVEVVGLMARHDPLEVVHVAALGLLRAVEVGHDPARVVLARLLPRLQERGWLGDDELVEEFERVMSGDAGGLRPTPVDLGELASHLEGPTEFDEGWMLEIATGRLWPRDPVGMAGIDEPDDFDDPEAFAAVIGLGSGPGYGDMRDFIGTVTDDALAGRLSVAIQGKGAFRRFKDTLSRHEDWWGRWLTFSNERQLARARWWLADAGLRPASDADESSRD